MAAFLGKPGDAATIAQANQAITIVTAMASAYTRGEGFAGGEPSDDIAAVIFTAALRFLANKSQLEMSKAKGPFAVDYRSAFDGWSLAEQYVLNRYRKRAE
ncbi:hypothetical protein [Mycolicibacterium elephantis]|nr:hypothetical protein [Mycolicibacterium elephantis]